MLDRRLHTDHRNHFDSHPVCDSDHTVRKTPLTHLAGTSRRRRTPAFVVGSACLLASLLGACGGSDNGKAAGSSSDGTVDASTEKTIKTLLEAGTGQRGAKEDAPGKIRFLNLIVRNGSPTDVDIWWGRPDEKAKAASVRYGEASDYLTPKRAKGNDSAVYTVTVAGGQEELWTWDRFTPTDKVQRTAIFSFNDEKRFTETSLEEALDVVSPYSSTVDLPAPDSGRVRLLWRPLGNAISAGDNLLTVMGGGGDCLTNGTGIAGPDGNQLNDGASFQVAPGTSLALYPNCQGTAASAEVKAPASGRGLLIAHLDGSNKPTLLVVPVKG
jgi:hypothetical protein